MTLSEVIQLLALIGGAVFCDLSDYMDDFQRQKEMTASALRNQAVILFDLTPEER